MKRTTLLLNPGVIFALLLLLLGAYLLIGNQETPLGLTEQGTLSMGSRSPVSYTAVEPATWGDVQPIALTGNHNFYSARKDYPVDPNAAQVQFRDVTLDAGIDFFHAQGAKMINAISEVIGSGACTADYDNDGYLDLYAVNGTGFTHFYGRTHWSHKTPENALYHNQGNGSFSNATRQAGVGHTGWGMGCAFGDYDNDGHADLYVTNYGANVLYHNNGDGTFSEVTQAAGVGDQGWGTSAAWGDYDNDGDVDLYVANYLVFDKSMNPGEPNSAFKIYLPLLMSSKLYDSQRNVLYRNNGDGTFTDVTAAAGVDNASGRSMGVVFADVNADGYPDIYITNDKSRNVLYLNNGNGTFTDMGGPLEVDSPMSGMGVTVGDYDRDGDLDIFSTYSQKDTNILYRNTLMHGRGQRQRDPLPPFADATMQAGLGEEVSVGYLGWGTEFFDYDNDGNLDLFVANGHGMPDFDNPRTPIGQRNQLFQGNGIGFFVEVSSGAGKSFKLKNSSRGAALGDYDNDGDIDIFIVNNNSYATLLRNDGGNANHWLNLMLVGTRSNRDGIGARVKVIAGPLRQIHEVRSGSSYLSQSDRRLHFGLGDRPQVDRLEIRWPSGLVESFTDVKANQFLTLVEGEKRLGVARAPKPAESPDGTPEVVSPKVRQQAVMALGHIGDPRAITPLLLSVQDHHAGVRQEAVKALRRFRSDRAIQPVILALEDQDAEVRQEAAATLRSWFQAEERGIPRASVLHKRLAVPALLRALEDQDAGVRQEAITALGFSESYRASMPVARMLHDPSQAVRREAAAALGRLRDKRATAALRTVLHNPEAAPEVRATAIIALQRLESPDGMTPLISALQDPEADIRHQAALVFVALFEASEGLVIRKEQAIAPLTASLADPDPRVRRVVVQALGLVKQRQVREPLLASLRDTDVEVRQRALTALATLGDRAAVPQVIQALQDDNAEVRQEAARTLGALRDTRALPQLMHALSDTHLEVRRQAAISLGALRDKRPVPLLTDIIHNDNIDRDLRLHAMTSLVNLDRIKALEILSGLLDHPDHAIRKEAVRRLGRLRSKTVVTFLIKKLADEDNEVRREAALILGSFRDNRVFAPLTRMVLDNTEDHLVRAAAAASLSRFGNKRALFPLLKVVKRRNDDAKPAVIDALGAFKDDLTVKHLMVIIKNTNEHSQIRAQAITTLSRLDGKQAVETLIHLIRG